MIDVQMLIVMYMIFIVCYYICCACATIRHILQGPLVITFFVASWIGTGEAHVVGSSCFFVPEIDLSRID